MCVQMLRIDLSISRKLKMYFVCCLHAIPIHKIDQNHYPERLGTLFVINAPRFFSGFWVPHDVLHDIYQSGISILTLVIVVFLLVS